MDNSQSTLDPQIKANPYRVDLNRKQVFRILKSIIIIFNGVLIIAILVGLCVYFSEIREKTKLQLEETTTSFSDDLLVPKPPSSSGPKYGWLVSMFAFALLLVIPCIGFIGAIKENVCLLILYGVIFTVEAIVVLMFRSFWFLFPTLIASSAMGLVILIRSDAKDDEESKRTSPSRSGISWCMDKV